MKILEERIIEDGIIINNDILKVDSFINHQIDVALVRDLAKEINNEFKNLGVNKILTIETSGIAFAYAVAEEMGNLPLVFGKKSKSLIVGNDVYKADIKSFTRNTVSTVTVAHKYLKPGDTVLIVDDFLAEGNASLDLISSIAPLSTLKKIFETRSLEFNEAIDLFTNSSVSKSTT
jgi:xanthine phosphoribosyltransferase